MVPIDGCAKPCSTSAERSTLRLCLALSLVSTLLCGSSRALASETVWVAHDDPRLDAVVERLITELTTDGYSARRAEPSERSPCEGLSDAKPSEAGGAAWVFVSSDAANPEGVVASICSGSAVTVLQRVSSRGRQSEPERFALTTAEALNGLRAPVPWVVPQTPRRAEPERTASPPACSACSAVENAVTVAPTAVLDAAGVPPLWGAELLSTVGIAGELAWELAAFLPATSVELESPTVSLRARTSWLRLGPSLYAALGPARARVSLLAGPVLTWASADARGARIGAADVAFSSLVALGAALQYPRASTLFVQGAAHVSALFPAVRLALAEDDSHALGPLLFDLSFGVGLRWGAMTDPAKQHELTLE